MASDRDTLPPTVKPSNYALSLYDLELGGSWTYQGKVNVDLEIKQEVKEITLNTHEIKIHSAQVQTEQGKTEGSIKSSNVSYDEKNQRATIHFDQSIPQAHKAVLSIDFQGIMNNDMAGFYRSKYKSTAPSSEGTAKDGEYECMFSTQFESCDARRAFPCFDEPNLKASIEFDIEIPNDQTALSNMPEKESKPSKKSGFKVVSFDKSPVMSTYLFAWAFGDFEYIEDFTRRKYNGKNLPVRVYTTRGLKEQGKLALESSHKITDFYSDTFEIEYPLPKVDLLAVHEFASGAMENWGLITYRTTAILFDDYASDQKYKNRIVYVVAHELAHQWFGNLVTMDWWDELWLNEGFATWVGWYATDFLHPDWDVWGQFVAESMQSGYSLDSLRTSHPIQVPVKNSLEVDQIFDAISYLKGSSVIRMLAAHLGPKVFLKGVASYLKANTYGNATTDDLWAHISKASGVDVAAFMTPWIKEIGHPLVTVAEEPGQISLKQSRFLITGDVKAEEDKTTWWVPLRLRSGAKTQQASDSALTGKSDTIRDIDNDFYKINSDQTGFYRTNLPPERLTKLGSQLDSLSVSDKIGLVGDASAVAISGAAKTPGVLALLEGFVNEDNYLVWSGVAASLHKIRSVFSSDQEVSEGLRKFTLNLVTKAADKIGWDASPDENYLTGQLRSLLIQEAGLAGHASIVGESKKRFTAFTEKGDKDAIPPSLRSAVFKTAIKEGGQNEYQALRKEFATTPFADGKEVCLVSMANMQSPELAQEHIKWAFNGGVPGQDLLVVSGTMGGNSKVRMEMWKYMKNNWESFRKSAGTNNMLVDRIINRGLANFSSKEVAADIQAFFKDIDTAGFDRGIAIANDSIVANASYLERDLEVVREWLKAHGYVR